MSFGPLEAWDASTLDLVAASDETAVLEKKAADMFDPKKQETTAEIAKQLSAFSNTGHGYLVFGIDNHGKLDRGIPDKVGNQPVKEWAEGLIARLVEPPVFGVRARFLTKPGHHGQGFGVLVLEIPLSGSRPHWVRGPRDTAYMRVGEHSHPMPARTMLDVASRQGGASGEVFDLHVRELTNSNEGRFPWSCCVYPSVGLVAGVVCREWGVELAIDKTLGLFPHEVYGTPSVIDGTFYIEGKGPLLQGRRVRLCNSGGATLFLAAGPEAHVRVTLFVGNSTVVQRLFRIPLDGGDMRPPDVTLHPVDVGLAG